MPTTVKPTQKQLCKEARNMLPRRFSDNPKVIAAVAEALGAKSKGKHPKQLAHSIKRDLINGALD